MKCALQVLLSAIRSMLGFSLFSGEPSGMLLSKSILCHARHFVNRGNLLLVVVTLSSTLITGCDEKTIEQKGKISEGVLSNMSRSESIVVAQEVQINALSESEWRRALAFSSNYSDRTRLLSQFAVLVDALGDEIKGSASDEIKRKLILEKALLSQLLVDLWDLELKKDRSVKN